LHTSTNKGKPHDAPGTGPGGTAASQHNFFWKLSICLLITERAFNSALDPICD
jgi:hypothetical protein